MKYLYLPLLWILIGACSTNPKIDSPSPNTLRIATYNILNINTERAKEGAAAWPERSKLIAKWTKEQNIDVLGVQEDDTEMLKTLEIPGYSVSTGPASDMAGEHNSIYFNAQKFVLLNSGSFWLGKKDGEKAWDAAMARIAHWVQLKNIATKKEFFSVNTHFDHIGTIARRESAKLITTKIKNIAGLNPVILTGDFNTDENDDAIKTVEKKLGNTRLLSVKPVEGTRETHESAGQIDFVFASNDWKVLRHQTINPKEKSGCPLSDHSAVVVDLQERP